MIIISTHSMFYDNKDVYGPAHALSLFLNKNNIDHIFIKHRLLGNGYSEIEYYKKGNIVKKNNIYLPKVGLLQFPFHILISLIIGFKNARKNELFIGVDPINAMSGVILKATGGTKKTVFLCADFSLKRFQSQFFSRIYLWLDKKAMFGSDENWSISDRIMSYRRKQGLCNQKNFLLPNSQFFSDVKRSDISQINKNDLVIVSALEDFIAFEVLMDVVANLAKEIKNIRLLIVGSGSKEKILKDYVKEKKLVKNIIFLGALSHKELYKILSKSGVGIALYENYGKKHFRYFSDSMKIWDYLVWGLPVIVSGNISLGFKVKKQNAGILINTKYDDVKNAIKEILKNDKLYFEMRKNAIEMAQKSDIEKILKQRFRKLLLKHG